MKYAIVSLKLVVLTQLGCCVIYLLVVLAAGRLFWPDAASGSLVSDARGVVLGSRLVGQAFTSPRYFWPRPSAVDYDAAASGGSNLSPASPVLTARARAAVGHYGAVPGHPLPADLAAASGSGLDPDISVEAALFQTARVAAARNLPDETVRGLVNAQARSAGGIFAPERIVNVFALNLALDATGPLP